MTPFSWLFYNDNRVILLLFIIFYTVRCIGGYAKEMSKEWFEAADQMLLDECKHMDVIITTALIPGRKAPILIKKVSVVE